MDVAERDLSSVGTAKCKFKAGRVNDRALSTASTPRAIGRPGFGFSPIAHQATCRRGLELRRCTPFTTTHCATTGSSCELFDGRLPVRLYLLVRGTVRLSAACHLDRMTRMQVLRSTPRVSVPNEVAAKMQRIRDSAPTAPRVVTTYKRPTLPTTEV